MRINKKKDTQCVSFVSVIFVLFNIFHNIAHLAVKYFAEHLDGMCADAFVPFQAGDLRGTDVVLLDEGIL